MGNRTEPRQGYRVRTGVGGHTTQRHQFNGSYGRLHRLIAHLVTSSSAILRRCVRIFIVL